MKILLADFNANWGHGGLAPVINMKSNAEDVASYHMIF
jgi:hypothetical protein